MTRVTVENVWKAYGDQTVLENVNLEIEPGSFMALVGPSGCGKSTFLRMMLGDEAPSRGRILLDGEELDAEPSPDRGVVFQKYSVFPHLTALQNVMLGLEFAASPVLARLFGKRNRAAKAEALDMLNCVGLGHAVHKYPSELSGGMQQRLALAQALIKKPKVLLLDEPFGALDPGIRKEMHDLVLGLWRQYGLTIFMVTHDLKEGFHLGTRLWVFDKVRHDPHAPNRFGSTITYDLSLQSKDKASTIAAIDEINAQLQAVE